MKGTNGKARSSSMTPQAKWAEYNRRKDEWIRTHGWVSEAEYQAAIKRICDDLGL